jgi:hypothetical protein
VGGLVPASYLVACVGPAVTHRVSVNSAARSAVVTVFAGRSYSCTVSSVRTGYPSAASTTTSVALPATPGLPRVDAMVVVPGGVELTVTDLWVTTAGPAGTIEAVMPDGSTVTATVNQTTRRAVVTLSGYTGTPRVWLTAIGLEPAGVGRSAARVSTLPRIAAPVVSTITGLGVTVSGTPALRTTIRLASAVAGDRLRLLNDGVPVTSATIAGLIPDADGWIALPLRTTTVAYDLPLVAGSAYRLTVETRSASGATATSNQTTIAIPDQLSGPLTGTATRVGSVIRLRWTRPVDPYALRTGWQGRIVDEVGNVVSSSTYPTGAASGVLALPLISGAYSIELVATGRIPESTPTLFAIISVARTRLATAGAAIAR